MAKPLTDDEKDTILELVRSGMSCTAVAEKVGRSPDTVSRLARSIGWRFGDTNAARAREARSAYSAEQRAATATRMHERADELLEMLDQPITVFNFGGKDNTFESRELDRPTVRDMRDLVQAAREAMRTVLDIDRHDNRADDVSAVDAWLASMTEGE